MTISDFTGAGAIPASVRTLIAEAFSARGKRRAAGRGGEINDHLLRDIGVTPFGVREATLAERNEARR